MAKDDLTEIKKKLVELETNAKKQTQTIYATITAILQILADKGITNKDEVGAYLMTFKEQYKHIADDAEFLKLIEQLKKKRDDQK